MKFADGHRQHCKTPQAHLGRRPQTGLAYLSLMIAIALIGLVSASAVQLGVAQGQRGAEEQLLAIGEEFQSALNRYADATPAGLPRSPLSLEELVRDPRYPGVVRHLRQLRADPFTGNTDWATIRDQYGRVLAVHSRSKLKPLKTSGFEMPLGHLEGRKAKAYEEWVFWGPGMTAVVAPDDGRPRP